MILGLGDIIGPVHATKAFFCVTSQSTLPSNLITANESRCVFVAIVAEICVLLVTYNQPNSNAEERLFDICRVFRRKFSRRQKEDFEEGERVLMSPIISYAKGQ